MSDNLSSEEAIELIFKTVCLIAHTDGEVGRVEIELLEKLLVKADTNFKLRPTDRWGSYDADVRGALMYYSR